MLERAFEIELGLDARDLEPHLDEREGDFGLDAGDEAVEDIHAGDVDHEPANRLGIDPTRDVGAQLLEHFVTDRALNRDDQVPVEGNQRNPKIHASESFARRAAAARLLIVVSAFSSLARMLRMHHFSASLSERIIRTAPRSSPRATTV